MMTQVMRALALRPVASALYMLLTLGDIVSTEIGMRIGMREINLLPAWVMATYGRGEMYTLRIALAALVFLAVARLASRFPGLWLSIFILNWMVGVVVFGNFLQLLLA